MEDIGDLFKIAQNDQPVIEETNEPIDYGQKVMDAIENEYKNLPNVDTERKVEKALLEKQMKELTIKLRKTKNTKNHRRVIQNTAAATKRKEIKAKIEELKDQIYNIDLEDKGSNITSTNLTDASITQAMRGTTNEDIVRGC